MRYQTIEQFTEKIENAANECIRTNTELWQYMSKNKLGCGCEFTSPYKIKQANNVVRVVKLCDVCGRRKTSGIKKSDYNLNQLPWIPDPIPQYTQYQEIVKVWIEYVANGIRAERSREWWNRYNEYLKSHKWQLKRTAVLKRDGYLCQACLHREANQVHHLTYERVFDEPLFDLVAVCEPCHGKIHK